MDSLIVDNEFQLLTLELSDAEYERLEENIFDKGCLEPLHIWNGIILDGHKRYKICKKWDILFSTQKHSFKSRHEAIAWICRNNLVQPAVYNEMNTFLLGKHYEAAKALYLIKHTPANSIPKHHYRVAGELGEIYNTAPSTVYKYGMYTRSIMKIWGSNPEFTKKILTGRIKVSHANIVELSQYPPERLNQLYNFIVENKIDHVCYSKMRHELFGKKSPSQTKPASLKRPMPTDNSILRIKQMPTYDPDAEFSSLTLTIPSWISSIKRTQSSADLTRVSKEAKANLNTQLHHLKDAVYTMLTITEEEV